MVIATLVWAPSHSANLAGYKVYYGQTSLVYTGPGSPKDVGNVIETTIVLPTGGRWYFALSEYYSGGGGESALSAETFADYYNPTTSIAVWTSGIFRLRHR